MSGDRVVLTASSDSVTARLVRALSGLPAQGFERFCVIGGLAVLCRVGNLYRVTSDVDTIVDDDAPAVAALRARPSALPTTNGVSIDGTNIDIIEIAAIDDPNDLPDDPDDRLFLLSHRFAYDHAAPIEVDVVEALERTAPTTRAHVAMATRSALIAMKLQSYPRRRGPSAAKQGSDMLDLVNLLIDPGNDEALGRELATAELGMGALCMEAVRHHLVEDADVAAGRVRRYTTTELDAAEIEAAGLRLIRAIQAA